MSVLKFDEYADRKSVFALNILFGIIFVFLSICVYITNFTFRGLDFLLGLLACFSTITIFQYLCRKNQQTKIFKFASAYTMPVFLMHTLFAASLRALLLKIGVQNAFIHVFFGIGISFAGPIIAAVIMERCKYLEWIIYPMKCIKTPDIWRS